MLIVTTEPLLDWTGGGWHHMTVHRTPLTHREAMLRCEEEEEAGGVRLGAYDVAASADMAGALAVFLGLRRFIGEPVRPVVEPGAVFLVPLNGVLMGELPHGPGGLTCLLYECEEGKT